MRIKSAEAFHLIGDPGVQTGIEETLDILWTILFSRISGEVYHKLYDRLFKRELANLVGSRSMESTEQQVAYIKKRLHLKDE